MKNTIKMSLVAAMAVAGLSTSASAVNLEEAIKGVDVSGMIRYRYEDTSVENGTNSQLNDYDAEVNVKIPVNDMVTANLKIDVAGDLTDTTAEAGTGDAKPSVNLEDVYFTFNPGYATIMAGKQNIPGPFTDGGQGTGIVALVPAGPVTVAAGYFNMHDQSAVADRNATAAALIGSLGPVNFDIWYADVDNVLDVLSIHASANIGPVAVDVRHSEKELDGSSADISLTYATVSGKVGDVSLTAGYAKTGDDNGGANGTTAIDNDNDAAVDFKVWQASMGAVADDDAYLLAASMPMGPVTASITYVDVDDAQIDETMVQIKYPMSKNFTVTTRYSVLDNDGTDTNKGRLELKYTF